MTLTVKELVPLTYKIPYTTIVIAAAGYTTTESTIVDRWRIRNIDGAELNNQTGLFEIATFAQTSDPILAYQWYAYHSFASLEQAIEFYNHIKTLAP